jgi:hypothetical protein
VAYFLCDSGHHFVISRENVNEIKQYRSVLLAYEEEQSNSKVKPCNHKCYSLLKVFPH